MLLLPPVEPLFWRAPIVWANEPLAAFFDGEAAALAAKAF